MREAATGFSADTPRLSSPSLGELTAIALLGPPCCGHLALCDCLCRDEPSDDAGMSRPLPAGRR